MSCFFSHDASFTHYRFSDKMEARDPTPMTREERLTMDSPQSDAGSFPQAPPRGLSSAFTSNPRSSSPGLSEGGGYFALSRKSSNSTISSDFHERPAEPSRTSTTSSLASLSTPTIDPLSRTYPKPTHEINVAEALSREPRKWTLGYWAKNAKDMPLPMHNKEVQARKFEEAKRELLRAKAELAQVTAAKR